MRFSMYMYFVVSDIDKIFAERLRKAYSEMCNDEWEGT